MEANYRYVMEKIASLASDKDAAVLDYGCGAGEIVEEARSRGFRIYGVEEFYEGANSRELAEQRGLLGDAVRNLDAGRIPFEDNTFDLVVSNQVFEHIPDLAPAVAEIARVLKPGGRLVCLFPTLGTLREVHCGIPVVHWLPKQTRARYYWLLAWRTLGFGSHKAAKSRRVWAADFHQWLNDFTHYRSRRRIAAILRPQFEELLPLENDYLAYRLRLRSLGGAARAADSPLLRPLSRLVVRCYGGVVMSLRKRRNLPEK